MPAQKSLVNDLTQGSVTPMLLRFSLPFVVSNALQTLYALVDMIVVGHFVGTAGVSAISITSALIWLLTTLGIGFSSGGQVVIAQLVGVRDMEGVNRTVGTLFSTVTIMSLLFGLLGVIFTDDLLRLLKTPAEAMQQAHDYMIISSYGMLFIYGYNMVSSVLRGMGDSTRPLIFIAIASVINVVLNIWFVGFLGLQAAGSALATVIGQAASFIISIVYLYTRRAGFGFDFKLRSFAIVPDRLKMLARLGIPMTFQMVAINISMLFVTAYVNGYGLVASTIFGIGNRINSIMFIITNSMQTAGASMIGQNFSAGKLDRVKKIYWASMLICCAFGAVACSVVGVFPETAIGLFTDDAEVLAMAQPFSLVIIAFFITFALMTPSLGLIMGQGFAALNFIIAMLDGVIVRILLSFFLGETLGIGLYGFFWGNALAGLVSVIWGNLYFFTGSWKKRRALVERAAEV